MTPTEPIRLFFDVESDPNQQAATGAESSGEVGSDEASAASDENKGQDGLQERLNQITREKREALEENARLRGQVEGFTLAQQQRPPQQQTEEEATGAVMTRDSFETDAEYQDALTKQITANVMKNVDQSTQAQTAQQKATSRQAQLADAAKETPEILTVATQPFMTDIMLDAADSDSFAKVHLNLGKNLAEASRIATLSPAQQAKEIGKIEARLSQPAPAKKTTTQAPDPAGGVGGGGGGDVDTSDPNKKTQRENMSAWEASRLKQLGVSP